MNHPIATAPRLSIIVATRNAERVLGRCLASIFDQQFGEWELLIKDGGSTDRTMDIVREHAANIIWWQTGKDNGIYDAWNQALQHAQGEYVCFLGSDDAFSDNEALGRLFTAIGDQRYDLVTSQGRIINTTGKEKFLLGSEWDYRRIGRRMVVCHPGLLHRRALFDRLGPFDARYRIAGDLEFLLRIPSGAATLHVDTVSVVIEEGGISRTNILARLREQREALARCPRYGVLRAYVAWADKLWRYPVARLLDIPH